MSLATVRRRPDPAAADEVVIDVLAGRAPALVYLHGMTSTSVGIKSERLLERARRRGQAFARFDFRGHGESAGELGTTTLTDLLADTRAVLDEVGDAVLVGSSMGAVVAAFCARADPRVRALVLLSPAFGYLPEMARRRDEYALPRGDDAPVTLRDEVLRDAAAHDEVALPGALRVPLLVVHGTDDRTVPVARSEAFCREVPHADKELWRIAGGSHSLNEDIDAVFDRVESFLDERGL